MAIVWNDDLKTGISAIDEQHQFLLEMIANIEAIKNLDEAGINKFLLDLQSYVSIHFNTEEDYMLDSDYSGYESHKRDHDKVLYDFKNALNKITNDYSVSEVANELVNYVEAWFFCHYSNQDVKMADYLKANSWQFSAERIY